MSFLGLLPLLRHWRVFFFFLTVYTVGLNEQGPKIHQGIFGSNNPLDIFFLAQGAHLAINGSNVSWRKVNQFQ